MKLEELGYLNEYDKYLEEHNLASYSLGRVISEYKERYMVSTATGDYYAEITGKMLFSSNRRHDLPIVGDWVACMEYEGQTLLIHSILPRKNVIERQAVDKFGEKQVIASNVDIGLIIQSVDRDYNINRLERYLTICNSSNVIPVVVISKTDLMDQAELNAIRKEIEIRLGDTKVIFISNKTKSGYEELERIILKGKTYCLLGSSGVGKTSLINNLTGESLATNDISEHSNRGKHTTTRRDLITLISGGLIIDNPGMREVGVSESVDGIENTFAVINDYAEKCRYNNCSHTCEEGCAVIAAVESGNVEKGLYNNYIKLVKEREHVESSVAEKRRKDKDFGKMVKNVKKIKNKRRL